MKLQKQLIAGTFHSSQYYFFKRIEHGKERFIADLPLYPDRVLHWAICLVAEPLMNRKIISHVYSSIPGRGYHQAVSQLSEWIKEDSKIAYALIVDVHHYFASIDIGIMKGKLSRTFKDRRFLELMFRLLDEYPEPGIPLGNRYSPMIANLFLSAVDHNLTECNRVHYYVRFMDDICILGYSREWLQRILKIMEAQLSSLGLELKPSKRIIPITDGIPFLGYKIYPTYVLLRRATKVRMKRNISQIQENEKGISCHDKGTLASYHGVLSHCNGRHLEVCVFGPLIKYVR